VRVEGREAILGLRCSGRGAVIVTAHVGCLELCRALAGRDEERFPLTVLVHTRHAERFNRMLQRLDPHTQVELLQVTEVSAATSLMLAERIERGELVAIVGDRVPVTPSKTVRVPFLGHEAAFPVGAYVLAALLRCPLFFMGCVRQGRGHLVRFRPITGQVALPRGRRTAALAQLVQAYVQELEALLVQSPFEWFNFFPFWDQAPTFPDTSHVQDP
jgi:predicted LPLAT superfamily acyltransferase